MSAESIWNKPLTKAEKASLARLAKRPIDYSDIPALTDAQLREFRRPAKKLVAVRLDADVYEWLQQFGAGYSTRINHVLRTVMTQSR